MSIAAMLLVALTTMMSLTSCEDEAIASDLEGTWEGRLYMSKTYNGRTYDSTSSKIEFNMSPFKFKSGTGYWVDYYDEYGWGCNYVASRFNWTVNNGRICITFSSDGVTVYIENYSLSRNHFSGVLYDGNTRVDFDLVHTYSPNWNSYNYYDYDYWYSKSGTFESRSASSDSTNHPLRFINVNK